MKKLTAAAAQLPACTDKLFRHPLIALKLGFDAVCLHYCKQAQCDLTETLLMPLLMKGCRQSPRILPQNSMFFRHPQMLLFP